MDTTELDHLAATNRRYAELARETYRQSDGRLGYADGGPYAYCAIQQAGAAADDVPGRTSCTTCGKRVATPMLRWVVRGLIARHLPFCSDACVR